MFISFYEEFPLAKGNLEKLTLVNHPTNLYLAADSYDNFSKSRDKARKIKPDLKENDSHWWITLPPEEGYYPSPFNFDQKYYNYLRNLLDKYPTLKIHIDLEFPPDRNILNFLNLLTYPIRHPHQFSKNKKRLTNLFNEFDERISTVEYATHFKKIPKWVYYYFGLCIDHQNRGGKASMAYTAFSRSPREWNPSNLAQIIPTGEHRIKKIMSLLEEEIKEEYHKYKDRLKMAFGPIKTGIFGDEPVLSPSELDQDLSTAQENGIKEVIIFRLGGYTPDYARVVEKYV